MLTDGWRGTLFYILGKYSAFLIIFIIETLQMKVTFKRMGYPLSSSERNFFNAYRLHASRIGVTTNLELKEGEVESGKWRTPFLEFKSKYPEVVERFTDF